MRLMDVRSLWLLPLPLLAIAWLVAANLPPPGNAFRIIVTEVDTPIAPNSVIELADQLGYYKRQGVNVELLHVQGTPTAIAALSAGQGDMANISFDAVLQLLARGQLDLKGVVSPNKALPYVIVAKDSITTPRMLEGRVIGIGRVGSVDYLQLRNVLARLGVRVDAIRYLSVGQPAQRSQALAVGQIDATAMTIGSWLAMPDRKGLHVLVDQKRFAATAPFITKLSVVTAGTEKTRRREIAAVVRATIEASRDFARDPDLWASAMAKRHPEIPGAKLEQLARIYDGEWSVDGGLDRNDAAYTTAQLYKSAAFRSLPRVPPESWIDTRYIDDARARLGPYSRSAP